MTKTEYINSIETDADTLETFECIPLSSYTENTKEYQLRYLKKDGSGNASIETVQFFEFNNKVYPRI